MRRTGKTADAPAARACSAAAEGAGGSDSRASLRHSSVRDFLVIGALCLVVAAPLAFAQALSAGRLAWLLPGVGGYEAGGFALAPGELEAMQQALRYDEELGVYVSDAVLSLPSPESGQASHEVEDGMLTSEAAGRLAEEDCRPAGFLVMAMARDVRVSSVAELREACGMPDGVDFGEGDGASGAGGDDGSGAEPEPEYYEDWEVGSVLAERDREANRRAALAIIADGIARFDDEFFSEYDLFCVETAGSVLDMRLVGVSTDGQTLTAYLKEDDLEWGQGIVAMVVMRSFVVAVPKDVPGDAVQIVRL